MQREMSTTPVMATAMPTRVAPPNTAPSSSQAKRAVQMGSVPQIGAITAMRSPRSA